MNKLKLNDEKTEFLIMTSKYQQHNIQDHSINVGTTTIHASKSARNLGIVFDDNLCMDQHVKRACVPVSLLPHQKCKRYEKNLNR